MATSTCLPRRTTTNDIDKDIIFGKGIGNLQWLLDNIYQHRVSEIGIYISPIDDNLTFTFAEIDTGNSSLSASYAMTKVNNFLNFFLCQIPLLP